LKPQLVKKTKKQPRHEPLPGTRQMSTYLPLDLLQKVKNVRDTCARREGHTSHLARFYREAVEHWLADIDPETGQLKQPLKSWQAPQTIMVPSSLELFPARELRSSEAELIRDMNASKLMLWARSPGSGNVHVNMPVQLFTGQYAVRFRGDGWAEFLHPEDREITKRVCQEGCRDQRAFRVVYRIMRRGGEYRLIVDHVQPVFRPDGSFLACVGTMYEFAAEGVDVTLLRQQAGAWVMAGNVILPRPTARAVLAAIRPGGGSGDLPAVHPNV